MPRWMHACELSWFPLSKNRWRFFFLSRVLLHTLPLTLQGGSITAHNKHPVFGSQTQEVSVYCYWACTSQWIRGGNQNEECKPNFMFPIFERSLNKWAKASRRATTQRPFHASRYLLLHVYRIFSKLTFAWNTSDTLKAALIWRHIFMCGVCLLYRFCWSEKK